MIRVTIQREPVVGQELAERVVFGPLPSVDYKELNGVSLPHDPPEPLESPGRGTY
jgi:hypothetical protein